MQLKRNSKWKTSSAKPEKHFGHKKKKYHWEDVSEKANKIARMNRDEHYKTMKETMEGISLQIIKKRSLHSMQKKINELLLEVKRVTVQNTE